MGFKSNLSKSPKVANNIVKMFTSRAVVIALVVLVVMVLFTGLFVNMRKSVEGFLPNICPDLNYLNDPSYLTNPNNPSTVSVTFTNNYNANFYIKTTAYQGCTMTAVRVTKNSPVKTRTCKGCGVTIYAEKNIPNKSPSTGPVLGQIPAINNDISIVINDDRSVSIDGIKSPIVLNNYP